jgi:hypothetical protein
MLKNANDHQLVLVIEPWATEYSLLAGDSVEVVERGDGHGTHLELHVMETRVTVFGRTGTTLSVVRNGVDLD